MSTAGLLLAAVLASASGLTLEEALTRTQSAQPLLRAAEARKEAAEEGVTAARAGLLPQVNLSAQGFLATANNPPTAWLSPTDIIRTGTRPAAFADASLWTPFGSTFVGVGVRQPLVDLGAVNRLAAARATGRAAEAGYAFTLQEMLLRTAEAFYRALAAEEDLAAARAALARAKTQREAAAAGVQAGLKPALDEARARANEAASELRFYEAQGMADVARAALAYAMGSEPGQLKGGLVRPADLAPPALQVPLLERPDALALALEAEAAKARAAAERGEGLPQLFVVGSASYRGFAEVVPDVPNWGVGLVASVPLFLGGRPSAAAAQEEARARELEARGRALHDVIAYQNLEGERLLTASTRALSAAERQLEAARAGLEQAEGRYGQGLGSIVELVDAQTQLAAAEQAVVRARLNMGLSRVRILYSRGELKVSSARSASEAGTRLAGARGGLQIQ